MTREQSTPSGVAVRMNRRGFIKVTGGSATLATLAGCIGDDGGSGNLKTISFATPPVGMPVKIVIEYYLAANNKIQPRFKEDGYKLKYQLTFEDATLFASNQIDTGTVSYVEDARLGVEQDQQLVCFGNIEGVVTASYVKTSGPYDPANTGSVQQTLDKVIQENARYGIPGWAAGSLPHFQNVLKEVYGYRLAQENSDFNVQTTDRGTMPGLVKKGELAIGTHSASSAGLTEIVNGELKPIIYPWNEYLKQGWGRPPLVSLSTRKNFTEENPHVLLDLINMWGEGLQYVLDNIPSIASDKKGQEILEAKNQKEARYLLDLFAGNDTKYTKGLSQSALYRDPGLTKKDVETAKTLMGVMEDLGQIPSGWQDNITFMTKSDIEGMVKS